ncbi:MAG TPA: UvrD-helicase domain-containing protein [Bryobacteraceae bacterium]|jgi:ATP-dependent exoDNAse (exonuclease V) beta subunit|nr:UvrD-helicase domain-containing protein [Bryobacteraceae bacterium]
MTAPDSEQRRRALDPSCSFIVQAPAGSGKTELLNQRFLTLLARVDEPEAVLAITFTKKAAGEMRQRVLNALRDSRGPRPEEEHKALTWDLASAAQERSAAMKWDLFKNPARLRIRTIDSLCFGLTTQMPWVSRMGSPPDIAEEPGDLYAEAARRTIELLETDAWSDDVAALLEHLDNNFPTLQGLIAAMLAKRDQWLRHVAGEGDLEQARPSLEQALQNAIFDGVEKTRALVPGALSGEMAAVAAAAARNLTAERREGRALACAGIIGLPRVDRIDAWMGMVDTLLTNDDKWRKRLTVAEGFPASDKASKQRCVNLIATLSANEPLRTAMAELRHLPYPRFSEQQWQVLKALVRLLPMAVAQLKVIFAGTGQADYAEVAMAAQRALGNAEEPTDLALALDARIEHLLVDEFQDTSVSQYALIEKLTAGWQPGDGRTLFVVGDPMQSIYRFREAQVGLFLKASAEGIGGLPLELLKLTANFRSDRGVVEWVNENFPGILAENEDVSTGAIPYSRSDWAHPRGQDPAVTLHPFVGRDDEAEAAKVVELVHAAQARNAGKIAILVRARSHLAAILPALRQAGLRFRAVDIDSLANLPLIQDLTCLTRALLHPADRIAWLALLRAPWCGMSLAELDTLVARDPHTTVWALMREAPAEERLDRVRSVLQKAFTTRPTALREWVESVWLALGGPACAADETGLENAAAFFGLLEKMDRGGTLDVAAFEERIHKLYAYPDSQADDSLQVMTLYNAKGLEFVVIVPGLGRTTRSDEARLMLWLERPRLRGAPELLLAPISATGAEPDRTYSYLKRVEVRKSEFEAGRLLYVAATRAKSELHLLGHTALQVKNGIVAMQAPKSASLLRRMWTFAEPAFQRVAAALPSNAGGVAPVETRVPQTIQRLASGWRLPAPPPGPGAPEKATDERTPAVVSFRWAGDTVRHIGTVAHQLLRRIAEDGLGAWSGERIAASAPAYRAALTALGVPSAELEQAVEQVGNAIARVVEDARGRWILGNHHDAACEYALCGVVDSEIVSVRVDRTFIDDEGVRWIVDYKTSSHEGSGLEAFLDNERERYRGQLETYRRIFSSMEQRPVRAALYFPLLNGWREVEPEPAKAGQSV